MSTSYLTLLLVCILFSSLSASSQQLKDSSSRQGDEANYPGTTPPASHTLFAELGGPGILLSVNYDTRLSGTKAGLGMRVGIGSNLGSNPSLISLPVGMNYLAGHHGNYFELGAGLTYVGVSGNAGDQFTIASRKYNEPAHVLFGNAVLGYRRQPSSGGFNFRAGLSPFVGSHGAGMLPYLSMGCNF